MAKKIHYFTAILLILFIGGHLLNHAMLFISPEAHLRFMESFRKVYRLPVVEVLLYLAVYVQAVTGFKLLWKKWRRAKGFWDRLQLYSGAFLLYFLLMHTSAVLVGRYIWELDTNLYFGASVVKVKPFLYYYVFHYSLSVLAFFSHLACVHRQKMARYVSPRAAYWQAMALVAFGLAMGVLLVWRLLDVDVPKEYLDVY